MRSNIINMIILTIIWILCGCNAATTGFRKTVYTEPQPDEDITVYGQLDPVLCSQYFGGFVFILKNNTDKWLALKDLNIVFKNDSAAKYIDVVSQEQLVQWQRVINQQKILDRSEFSGIEKSILDFGTDVSGLSGILGTATDVFGLKKAKLLNKANYPESHLYANDLTLPPGMHTERWILFVSKQHQRLQRLHQVFLNYKVDGQMYESYLNFRQAKENVPFSWLGDSPISWRLIAEPYLIMNRVNAKQTLQTTDMPYHTRFEFPLEEPELGLHAELRKVKSSIIFDILSIRVTDKLRIPDKILESENGRFDVAMFATELLTAYRFLNRKGWVELLAGVRYKRMKYKPEITAGSLDEFKAAWFDPVIGGRLRIDLVEKVYTTIRCDFGGLGLESDFTWNSIFSIGYQFSKRTDIMLRFNGFRTKYTKNKNKSNAFVYNATEYRFLVGAAMQF